EKTAALAVVQDRLSRAGLSALCLSMHSKKANKKEVLKSLEDALRLSGTRPTDAEVGPKLAATRDQLNAWSDLIHKPIHQSGRSSFSVMGRQLKLLAGNVRLLPVRLDQAADWSAEKLSQVEASLDRVSEALDKLGSEPVLHPWYGTKLPSQSPF